MNWENSRAFALSSIIISILFSAVLYIAIDRNIRAYRDQYFNVFRGWLMASIGFALVFVGVLVGISLLDQWG